MKPTLIENLRKRIQTLWFNKADTDAWRALDFAARVELAFALLASGQNLEAKIFFQDARKHLCKSPVACSRTPAFKWYNDLHAVLQKQSTEQKQQPTRAPIRQSEMRPQIQATQKKVTHLRPTANFTPNSPVVSTAQCSEWNSAMHSEAYELSEKLQGSIEMAPSERNLFDSLAREQLLEREHAS